MLKKLNGKSAKDFNKWFNEMFEKVRVRDEDLDSGYGNGLNQMKTNEEKIAMHVMGEAFEKEKKK